MKSTGKKHRGCRRGASPYAHPRSPRQEEIYVKVGPAKCWAKYTCDIQQGNIKHPLHFNIDLLWEISSRESSQVRCTSMWERNTTPSCFSLLQIQLKLDWVKCCSLQKHPSQKQFVSWCSASAAIGSNRIGKRQICCLASLLWPRDDYLDLQNANMKV